MVTLTGGITRQVHVVRITDPKGNYIDVEVLNMVSIVFANGKEILYKVTAKAPYIIDDTGDGNNVGSASGCSRRSHMQRLTNPTDGSQFFDIEILDAITFTMPNGKEELFKMPNTDISAAVKDDTGNGLEVSFVKGVSTRKDHIVEIDELIAGGSTSSADKDYPSGPTTGNKLLIEQTDKIGFKSVNGTEFVLDVDASLWNVKDVTNYTADGAPPPNTDKNIYVRWTKGGLPWLGTKTPVKQGAFWRIKKVGIAPGPTSAGRMDVTYILDVGVDTAELSVANPGLNYYVQVEALPASGGDGGSLYSNLVTIPCYEIFGGGGSVFPYSALRATYTLTLDNVPVEYALILNVWDNIGSVVGPGSNGLSQDGVIIENNQTCFHGQFTATVITSPTLTVSSTPSPNIGSHTYSQDGAHGDLYCNPYQLALGPYCLTGCPFGINWNSNPAGSDQNLLPLLPFCGGANAIEHEGSLGTGIPTPP
jgi:hypothetical protein